MAGIGFELRKVASLGNARGLFQASLSGIMIVAGPWLISILTILLFQQPVMGIPEDFRRLFIASTIYIYSFSLILSGGFHYIFTRILSDYLFRNQADAALGFTLRFLAVSTGVLLPIGVLLERIFLSGAALPALHRVGFVLLFIVINHIWVLMLTASAMKRYNQLLITYTVGMAGSLLFMRASVFVWGEKALLMAYTGGQILLLMVLLLYLSGDMGIRHIRNKGEFAHYIRKYRHLFITGFVYYGALWADKMVFWIYRGERIAGTSMKLYQEYDIIVYLTNLMMIPGLVFFVIFSETEFYLVLRKFLDSLSRKPYHQIRRRQIALRSATRFIMGEQAAIQSCITLVFLTLAWFQPVMRFNYPIVIVTALSIMILGLFLTLLNFLFYIEQYGQALIGVTVFFVINTGGALLSPVLTVFSLPGVSTLTGCAAGTLVLWLFLTSSLKHLDRKIFTAITDGRLKEIREHQAHKQPAAH